MAQLLFFLLLFTMMILFTSHHSNSLPLSLVLNNETDHQALLSFKATITKETRGPLSSWNHSLHFCQWRGINCFSSQRVISLNLTSLGLTGPIPPSVTNLTSLAVLDLSNNRFHGPIVHDIGNLGSLVDLVLHENLLSGTIPPSIGRLNKLESALLYANNLTGAVPLSFWNLSSLRSLDLSFNQLSGLLPESAERGLVNLEQIFLYNNRFRGPIPTTLTNASSNLEYFDLSENMFSGTIPRNLGGLQNLKFLNFFDNNLTSEEEPGDGWGFMTALTNCSNLHILELDNNDLGGVLPATIANLSTELQYLIMDANCISGSIPRDIGNLVNLLGFSMSFNLLTGSVPDSLGNLVNLSVLDLELNKLSGEIPPALGNASQLISLALADNQLSGNIPPALGNCQNMNYLGLDRNRLTESIPVEIFSILSLSKGLYLSYNLLTGSIPSEIGNLRSLVIIDLAMNRLSGEIPGALGGCQRIVQLSLNGNLFHGDIPSSLRSLGGIEVLDISNNNLSGKIPEFLQDLNSLNYLNLSFNNFRGEVPQLGVFANASAVSVVGNGELCGGSPNMNLPACPAPSLKKNKRRNSRELVLTILVISPSLVLLVLLCFFISRHWRRRLQQRKGRSQDLAIIKEHVKLSYSDIVQATNGFSDDNILGRGSFGTVYKGAVRLGDDTAREVAVKVLNLQLYKASESFISECEAAKRIRHRNIVNIITICSSVDFRGNEFKAIVMELMVNGNLDDWLHKGEGLKKLSLAQRLSIAVDVASALAYLHDQGEAPIVHCDLKPTNVLLDGDMTAHLSDFGQTKFLEQTTGDSPQCDALSSVLLMSTMKEYGVANKVSTQGDVFSYGILLLEMFTAKRPTDGMFKGRLSLREFVESAVAADCFTDIIDARLLIGEGLICDDYAQNLNCARVMECISSVLKIALLCSDELPTERMQTADIISSLQKIMDVFLRRGGQIDFITHL